MTKLFKRTRLSFKLRLLLTLSLTLLQFSVLMKLRPPFAERNFWYLILEWTKKNIFMEPRRVELLTSCLQSRRTPNCTTAPLVCRGTWIKISNFVFKFKWAHLGSNQTPPRYQHGALPTELWARVLTRINAENADSRRFIRRSSANICAHLR